MNNNKLGLFYFRQKIALFLETGLYPLSAVLLAVLFAWQLYGTKAMLAERSVQRTQRDELQARLDEYRSNINQVSDQDRIVYGSILKKQLPPQENAFDMFETVDAFASEIGLKLSDYPVPDGDPSVRKNGITKSSGFTRLSATGTVSPDQLNHILDIYQFEFQRFMTLDSAQLVSSKLSPGKYDVTFGFTIYTVPNPSASDTESSGVKFTSQDKEGLDQYKEKVNTDLYVDITEEGNPVDTNYDAATSAF